MNQPLSRRTFLAGTGGAVSAGLAGCVSTGLDAEDTVTVSFESEGLSTLAINGTNGDITVERGGTDEIAVTVTRRASSEGDLDDVQLESTREGDTLELSSDIDRGLFGWFGSGGEMDFAVAVPDRLDSVRLDTTNGTIESSNTAEVMTATTTNGNGNLSGSGLTGRTDAETTNGNISLQFDSLTDDVLARTTNGDIEVTVPPAIDALLSCETTNGSISVADLDEIRLDSQTTELKTEVGDGTYHVQVETTNGNISLRGRS